MAPSGRDHSEFTHIKDVLNALLPGYQRGANTEMARIKDTWNRVLPPEVAENAQPAALKNDTLLVHVTSSTVSQQLRFLVEEIKQQLNADAGTDAGAQPIHTIKFKVGKLPA
jgi:predicted nucleic acid-binding Zn ribbon protein